MVDYKSLKYFAIALIITISLITPIMCMVVNKPDIHTAKHYELIEIQSIGGDLATDIIEYLNKHENATIDDLKSISGIGDKRIEYIRKVYND